jgi:Family of unknown function (DUF5684)
MEPQQLDQLDQLNQTQGGSPIAAFIVLAIIIFMIASLWKVFAKASEPGWAAIIPIYNVIVLLKISGKPLWWLILFFIPVANFIIAILAALGLAERFGKSSGFGIGLALLPFIFYPMLAFGSAAYVGPKTA